MEDIIIKEIEKQLEKIEKMLSTVDNQIKKDKIKEK
jgi:hypothetical protein